MIELVNPRLYVLESRLLGKLPSFEDRPPALLLDDDFELDSERIDTRRFSRLSDITDSAGPERQAGPDDMCYIYFTSGSTGTPKAIAGRFKSLAHFAQWEISELGVTDRFKVTQLANPTFDAYLRDIFVPLCSGATICIPEDRSVALDPVRLADWLDQKEITLMHCVPAVFRLMAGAKLDPGRMRSLSHIMMAGERLDPAEIKRWMDVFGERVQLINLYGATENTMAKFRYFITEADTRRRTIPIGKPIRGARAILVDEAGAVCDPGAIGEIYIRTPYLTLGYYNDPDLTRKVFAPNPFNSDPNDIVYKTGDYGRLLPDGNFELIGRKDQQVKIRGQRVELGEIEQALKLQPGVQDCAVRVWGDDPVNLRLAAYIARRPEVPSQAAELRSSLQAYLPDYMIPATFTFLDSLPLTSNGKVDRNALPPPDQSERQSETEFIAPRNEIEERLAEIWREALQIGQAGRVGINDNFFHLGGHSLLATQAASRIRDVFQIDAPLRKVFEKPTIAELAAVIAEAQSEREAAARTEALDLIERMSEEEIADALEQLLEYEAGQPVAQPVESSVARA